MNFTLTSDQMSQLSEWMTEHNKTCKFSPSNNRDNPSSPTGAIGGRFTYKFTPTGLGMCVQAECCCGKEVDLTDVEDW